ncbi:hypothetical protein ABZP36_026668 [Zizania latifolia]
MSEVMNRQFKILVSRFLAAEGLSLSDEGADKNWLDIVASLSWHAALLVKPDANVENAMNPGLCVKENENLEKTLSDVIGKCQPDVILVEKAVSRNVFISYGKKSSGELLLSYGFVPKEGTNPNDSVEMLVLEAFLAEGSELWMFNEVPKKERERKLIDDAMDIYGLTRITVVHKEGFGLVAIQMANDGEVVEDQEGASSSPCPTAAADAAEAAAAIARAARPPRPGRDKRLGVRHPLKHRRFRARDKVMVDAGGASSTSQAVAGAREVGEATTVAEATAVGPSMASGYICGGWKSEDRRMKCGYASFRGRRANMEDFYDIKSSKIDDKQINLFGIFDGHGGSRAAEYLKEHLFENLLKHPAFITDTKSAISETYRKTDSDFLDAETNIKREDGSTASTAILVGNHLYVANVGDSRAVMSKAGKAIALSVDHKPNRKDERKRIEIAGGVVMWSGTWRVGGVLAMSRAFGNRLLKRFVVAEPEIQEQEIDDDLEFLILASDGLWDVVSNEVAVAYVKAEEDPEAAARRLTEIAFARGSTDNITCIVVEFRRDKMAIDSPSGEQS